MYSALKLFSISVAEVFVWIRCFVCVAKSVMMPLQVLTAKCHSLVSISLLESPHLTDAGFKTIAETTLLKKLRIQGQV